MVRTRQSAAAALQNESASTDKRRRGEIPKRVVARKTAPVETARNLGKRTRGEAESDAPSRKRPASKRGVERTGSGTVVDDENEDEVPGDEMFFAAINDRVKGKTEAKGKASTRRKGQISQERRVREEDTNEEPREDEAAGAQEEDHAVQESREDDQESAIFVAQDDEDDVVEVVRLLYEEEQSDDDDSDREAPQPSATTNLENIASIHVISTDMTYIEPEPKDATPLTFFLDCDGLNTMIADMGKRGWTNEKGAWVGELLRNEKESETEKQWHARHSHVIRTKIRLKLFLGVIELSQNCKDMPKAPALDEQADFLQTHSAEIQKNLNDIQTLTQQIKNQASQPLQEDSIEYTAEYRRRKELWTYIYRILMPALVLALKEALLLGGYSRLETKPETISGKNGQFMACTLQFALRILGFIDQMYSLVKQDLAAHENTENKEEKALQSHRMAFANHVRVLQPRVLAGIQELKRFAEAPVRHMEMAERSKRARKAQQERDRIIKEKQDRQMKLFIASTQRFSEKPPPPPRDEYYEKHRWRLWEDEILLGVIRKTKSPNLAVLARQIPGRSTAEVINRVGELRVWMKAKYETAGIQPPKWCFQPGT